MAMTATILKNGKKNEDGRVFFKYLNKHGNDGYYLEEWKKDMGAYLIKKQKED